MGKVKQAVQEVQEEIQEIVYFWKGDISLDDIKTILLEYSETAAIKTLVNDLKALVEKHEIYRIKGFVNIPNKPMRMVLQGVGSRFDYYFERPWGANEERKTSIVVIFFTIIIVRLYCLNKLMLFQLLL